MRILLRARTMNVRPALAVCLLSACGPSYNGVDDGAYVNDNLGKARLLDLDPLHDDDAFHHALNAGGRSRG